MGKYRMNRPTYWFCYVVFMVAVTVLAYIGKLDGGMETMMIVVGVPRLHDIGRTGWLVGAAILAEIAIIVGVALAGASLDTIYGVSGFVFFAIAALGIWLGIIPGETGANKWGDAPKPGLFGLWGRTSERHLERIFGDE